MVRFVGLDVHKRVVEVCALDAEGHILWRHRFDLTRESLEAFVTQRLGREDCVALSVVVSHLGRGSFGIPGRTEAP